MSVEDNTEVVRSECMRFANDVHKTDIAHWNPEEKRARDAFHVEDVSFHKCRLKVKIDEDDAMNMDTGIWGLQLQSKEQAMLVSRT
jgi:hypothetical protein